MHACEGDRRIILRARCRWCALTDCTQNENFPKNSASSVSSVLSLIEMVWLTDLFFNFPCFLLFVIANCVCHPLCTIRIFSTNLLSPYLRVCTLDSVSTNWHVESSILIGTVEFLLRIGTLVVYEYAPQWIFTKSLSVQLAAPNMAVGPHSVFFHLKIFNFSIRIISFFYSIFHWFYRLNTRFPRDTMNPGFRHLMLAH